MLTLVDKFQTKIGRKMTDFLLKLNQEICAAMLLQKNIKVKEKKNEI